MKETIYFTIEDCYVERFERYEERVFIFGSSVVKPDILQYVKILSFSSRKKNMRIEFHINRAMDKIPSQLFVEGFLRTSDHPSIVRFRNDY